ncbi:oligosaccharide flippase family protein [Xanthocytophaga flava]|uniref:oligosaccharide flippase family protein n=1 Tax=Xanthocytophaga flava TaxID=3048013 RepID=UPI0028D8D914|nr:oligosaccharide flippase family protein [Xanthocytophaga flavus]MDJ1468593.1 oligosaccharide flippase family protein [Xanthocytophaga flavus]
MGVIIRQSLKASIVAYIGVGIGVINQLFVSTKYLSVEQMALSRLLLENSILFAAISHLGTPYIADKFFSQFRNEVQKHHGFLVFLLLYPLLGILAFTGLYVLFQDVIANYFSKESPLILQYHFLSIPLTAFWVYISVLEVYCRNHARITVPTIVREIYLKIANILLILIFAFGWIDFQLMMYLLVASYGIGVIILFLYIKNLGKLFIAFDKRYFQGSLFKSMFFFGTFIILGGLGQNIVLFVDRVMLAGESGLRSTGIFVITTYIASIIEIPKKTLTQISVPILSAAIQQNDIGKMKELYQKTALNQAIIGCLFFLGIWCNIDEIFSIIPRKDVFSEGKYVVLSICIAKLLDMSTGLNAEILLYSVYYRVITTFVIIMAIFSIAANKILIPLYDINGAAWATSLTTLVYCSVRVWYVWDKFKIHPFSRQTLSIIVITAITLASILFLPFPTANTLQVILTLFLRSVLILLVFGFLILRFRVSPDVNNLTNSIWKTIKSFVG